MLISEVDCQTRFDKRFERQNPRGFGGWPPHDSDHIAKKTLRHQYFFLETIPKCSSLCNHLFFRDGRFLCLTFVFDLLFRELLWFFRAGKFVLFFVFLLFFFLRRVFRPPQVSGSES